MAVANSPTFGLSGDEEEQNKEQQWEESEMLENIYSGEMTVLKQGVEYTIKITPQLKEKVTLNVPTVSKEGDPSKSSKLTEVSHLACISLYIKYPPTYPSHSPPECHVSAPWMESRGMAAISDHLRGMFEPQSLVVYDWVSYLQDEMVDDYVRQQGVKLSLMVGQCREEDRREEQPPSMVQPLTASPFQIFVRSSSLMHDMVELDRFETFQEFHSSEHACGICYDMVKGDLMCQPCAQCGLVYCRDCLLAYCKSCIGNSRMVQLECPDNDCHAVLPDVYLKEILPKDFLSRYIMLREKVELDSLPGMVFCPRCKQRSMSDPDSKVAVCDNPSCQFPFCKTCYQTWHGPGMCPNLEKVAQLVDGKEESVVGKKLLESEEEKKRRIEELKNMLWLMSSDSVKPCPSCKMTIQKSGGCNKMTCNRCNCIFCWLCGECIMGYEHFGGGKKKCPLFRDQDYLPTNEEEDVKGFDNLDDLENAIDDLEHAINTECPRCSKIELKSSENNWLQCRRCSFQYCYLCGEPCFGLYHFNEEYGCKNKTTPKEDAKLRKELRASKKE